MSSLQQIYTTNSDTEFLNDPSLDTSWIQQKIVTSKIDSNNDGTLDRSKSENWTYDENGNPLEYISSQDTNGDGNANRIETETWAYDENGNQTAYNYIKDNDGDGNSDRTETKTWAYDENGNQTAYNSVWDSDADGNSDRTVSETWAYDENGNQTAYTYIEDDDADGNSDRTLSETWAYNENGNQTTYIQKKDNNGDGIYETEIGETRTYDSYGSLIQYTLDDNGDDQNDHIANFFANYNAQGKLTGYGLLNWLEDSIYGYNSSGLFHGRTYDSNDNISSLWVDYDLNGSKDLIINYDSSGNVASYDVTDTELDDPDLIFLLTPVALEFSAYDSSGKVFDASSGVFPPRTFVPSETTFQGYVNNTLVADIDLYSSNSGYDSESRSLYDLEGKIIYEDGYSANRGEGTAKQDIYTYTYNAEEKLISQQRSYQNIDDLFFNLTTSGTETINYDTDGRIISELNEGSTSDFGGTNVFKSERTFSYDEGEDSTTITDTYLKDNNGDGIFDYQEITEENFIFATEEPDHSFDIDGDGQYSASIDGLLFYGYLNVRNLPSSVRNNLTQQLVDDLINPDGDATRKTGAEIAEYLESNLEMMDIDGNEQIEASIDGLLLYGYLNIHSLPSSVRDNLTQELANNLIPENSDAIRTLGGDISNFIESYMI